MQGSNTGSTIVASGASLNIEGSDSKRLSSYTLDNQGTINFQTTELQFSLGGIINNQGQFNSIGPGEFGGRTDQGSGTFNNQGIFTRSGEGSTIFSFNRNSNVAFNNSGIVNVTEGTLALSSLDTINTHSGEFIGEGTLEFGRVRGTHNFIENSSLTVNNVRITGATANFNGTHDTGVNTNFSLIGGTIAGEGTLTLNGPSSWSGGTMGGSNTGSTIVASGASLNIEGSDSKRLRSYTLDNQGTINFQTTQLQFGGGIINNQGQFNSIGPGEISGANGSGIFNNQGIFTRSGEGTTLFSFDGSSGANVAFNNSGIVNVTEGTLALSSLDTINTHSGEFIGEGTLEFGRVRGTHNFIENSSLTVNN
ncbi:MAG: hypothetical protein QNJ41_14855, partial [Xenococcaceae cyanobacterium MO_188.B32]|nr:hypothetical protein [Xenococcaceae cyanobacterium MO_188.B32]